MSKFADVDADGFVLGFYDDDIHGDAVPEGAVPITDEAWGILLEGQTAGKLMKVSADGTPELVDRPPPTPDEILAMNTGQRTGLVSEAAGIIDALADVVEFGTPTAEQSALYTEWRKYRAALMAVDLTAYPAAWPTKPAMP